MENIIKPTEELKEKEKLHLVSISWLHSVNVSVNSVLMTSFQMSCFFSLTQKKLAKLFQGGKINLKKESFGKQALSSSGINSSRIFILKGNTETQVLKDCYGSYNQQSLNDVAAPVLLPMETTCSVWMIQRTWAEETPKHNPCRGNWIYSSLHCNWMPCL